MSNVLFATMAALAIAWSTPLAAAAADAYTAKCVAAKTFEVQVTSGPQSAQLDVRSRRPDARISRVLLRSPYKSEGTALPMDERIGESGTYQASFDLDAIRRLPEGDVNVVVLTPDGERICRIKRKARNKLAAPETRTN